MTKTLLAKRKPNRKGGQVTQLDCVNPSCDSKAVLRDKIGSPLCNKHYQRGIKGDCLRPDKVITSTCDADGCDRPTRSLYGKHCETHYYRIRRSSKAGLNPIALSCKNCSNMLKKGQEDFCSSICYRVVWRKSIKNRMSSKSSSHINRAKKNGCDWEKFCIFSVFENSNWICGICDGKIDKTALFPDKLSASLDHIHPIAAGGGHILSNVQASHYGCNIKKAHKIDIPLAAACKRKSGETGQYARRMKRKEAGKRSLIQSNPEIQNRPFDTAPDNYDAWGRNRKSNVKVYD